MIAAVVQKPKLLSEEKLNRALELFRCEGVCCKRDGGAAALASAEVEKNELRMRLQTACFGPGHVSCCQEAVNRFRSEQSKASCAHWPVNQCLIDQIRPPLLRDDCFVFQCPPFRPGCTAKPLTPDSPLCVARGSHDAGCPSLNYVLSCPLVLSESSMNCVVSLRQSLGNSFETPCTGLRPPRTDSLYQAALMRQTKVSVLHIQVSTINVSFAIAHLHPTITTIAICLSFIVVAAP